jgi:hypothetical protein
MHLALECLDPIQRDFWIYSPNRPSDGWKSFLNGTNGSDYQGAAPNRNLSEGEVEGWLRRLIDVPLNDVMNDTDDRHGRHGVGGILQGDG